MKRRKLKLLFTLSVAVLSVFALATTTYAWYLSNASASVTDETASSGMTLTVAAPDEVEISNPEVYMYRGNPAGTNVDDDFDQVSTEAARTITDFCPGDQITIAIKVPAVDDTSISSGSMNLTYRGYSLSNRTIRGTSGSSLKVINILTAIKLSTGANGTGDYPTMTQKLTPIARGSEPLLSALTRVGSTTSYYKQATISNAINDASIASDNAYFFYTMEFLNTVGTFYNESSTGTGAANYNFTTPANDSSTRYFVGSDSGSSTCYEGLSFNVTAANIKVV